MTSVLRFDDWETTLGTGVVSTDGSGNLAVGGSSPSYKLDVTGDINATGVIRVDGADIHEVTIVEETVTMANATNTNPAFNTEIIDVGGRHASGSSNIYIPYDGIYLLTASMYAVNSANRALITIRKNSGGSASDIASQDNNSGGYDLTVSTQEKLLSGDYVFLNMWQNSGVTQTPVVRFGVSLVRKL